MLWVAKYMGLVVLSNKVMSMFFGSDFLKDPARKTKRKIWKDHFLANDRSGILKVIKGVLTRKSITKNLPLINQPCLIMVGEKDTLTDYSKAEIMHKNIKDSILTVIPRAAHMTPVEEPELVNSAIQDFLINLK